MLDLGWNRYYDRLGKKSMNNVGTIVIHKEKTTTETLSLTQWERKIMKCKIIIISKIVYDSTIMFLRWEDFLTSMHKMVSVIFRLRILVLEMTTKEETRLYTY